MLGYRFFLLLLHQPEVLFLDEPMSGLDPRGRRAVRDLLVFLKNQGKTIVMTTHLLDDVESICDRILLIEKGHLTKSGTLDEVKKISQSLEDLLYED